MAAPTGTIWKSLSYGYTPIYWMTLGGVAGVFTQRATGLTLPPDFNLFEDATLSLDDTASIGVDQVDRDNGVGCGMSLSFTLLDSARVASLVRKWSAQCTLTADITAIQTTVPVNNTAPWTGLDRVFYIGAERCTFNSMDATHFNFVTRGTAGTYAQVAKVGTTSQVITNLPRTYLGREVRLYATFADPSGYIKGTDLLNESVEVWRGRVAVAPVRRNDGFSFEADSLDRFLDKPLTKGQSGVVVGTSDYTVTSSDWTLECTLLGRDKAGDTLWGPTTVTIQPFTDDTVTADDATALIKTAWDLSFQTWSAQIVGGLDVGDKARISIAGTNYEYTAAGADDTDDVATQLVIAINAGAGDPIYTAVKPINGGLLKLVGKDRGETVVPTFTWPTDADASMSWVTSVVYGAGLDDGLNFGTIQFLGWPGSGEKKSALVTIKYNNDVWSVNHQTALSSIFYTYSVFDKVSTSFINFTDNTTQGMVSDSYADLGWYSKDFTNYDDPKNNAFPPSNITIALDEGAAIDAPTSGKVKITSGSKVVTYTYSNATFFNGNGTELLNLQNCKPPTGTAGLSEAELESGASAEIMYTSTGKFKALALKCLQSSGTGLRGSFDTLSRGQGYGITEDAIDLDSFDLLDKLFSSVNGEVNSSGKSFLGLFSGVLGMARLAIVSQPVQSLEGTPVQLQLVRTSGGTLPFWYITDNDLLAHNGDPFTSVSPAPGPTSITVEFETGNDDQYPLVYNDNVGAEDRGGLDATYSIPTSERDAIGKIANSQALQIFLWEGGQQAVKATISPAITASVGDSVNLSSIHPSLWSFKSNPGAKGYTGPALVSGRTLNPNTNESEITLLIEGGGLIEGVFPEGLCPSMQVLAWETDSQDPTGVTVDEKYDPIIKTMFDQSPTVTMIYYTPGETENSSFVITFDGYSAGGNLNPVVGTSLDRPLTTGTYLTFQETIPASPYQLTRSHVDDETYWEF